MINKKNVVLLVTGVLMISVILVQFLTKITPPTPTPEEALGKEIKGEVILNIEDGKDVPKIFASQLEEGMTAFGLLRRETGKMNISLEFKNYDFGVFVEKIGEKKNGDEGKYWLYYVNGEMPQVAADKYQLKSGDKVEFRFDKSKL